MLPLLALPWSSLIMIVGLVVVFYLMLIRPMRKQAAEHAKKQQALRDSLAAGVRVQLAGGLFGTVKHIGDKQAIVELAPGVEVTVMKDAILKTLQPADEEFEYEDDQPAGDEDQAVDAPAGDHLVDDQPVDGQFGEAPVGDRPIDDQHRADEPVDEESIRLDELDPPAQPGEQRV